MKAPPLQRVATREGLEAIRFEDGVAFVEVDASGRESLRVILPDGRTATLVVDDLTSAALLE